ncbi:MAG: BatA domain-containing protein [Gemmataceae bacterium]
MTFLQPLLLAALPLVALPVVIHLINQRRYQTVRWAAMMFLLAANRMARGYARIRQWLILAARTLAVAGLVFAVSRPLAGGWFGRAAGERPDTTLVLLDRSPSMRQQGAGTVVSKLESGRSQLARTLGAFGSGRWVLVDSAANRPTEIDSPDALIRHPAAEPVGTSADVPAMLEAARDYIHNNKAGRTDIWVCSDLRENDWNPDGGRWQTVRDSLAELQQGVRIHLLAYPEPAVGNVGVRVTAVRRVETTDGAEVLVSLKLTREGGGDRVSVPVQFDIEGTRSELTVELTGPAAELKDHRIPIERTRERGWGKVSVPADANPADNDFYFTFDRPQPRRTVVVSSDPQAVSAVQIAASVSPDPGIPSAAEVVPPDRLAGVEWDAASLVVWHAPLPEGADATLLKGYLDRGGQVVFLPPANPGGATFQGVRWRSWIDDANGVPVETWRGDQDALANTQSGAALPVGQLQVRRYCELDGELTPLATLRGGKPLVGRLPTGRGGVYFCATTANPADSTLAANGVVLYVFVQRMLTAGASALGRTRQLTAGESAEQPETWRQLAGSTDAVSTDYPHHAGVYAAGERLLAVNRAVAEDHAGVVSGERVAELFRGLDFTRVDDQAGSDTGLIQEVWRPFLIAMLAALLTEAALCMPRRATPQANKG